MAVSSSIYDSFGNVAVSSFWTPFGTTSQATGQLVCTYTSGTTNYQGYETGATYDFTGSFVSSRLVNAGNQALASWQAKPCEIKINSLNTLTFHISVSKLIVEKQIAGVYTIVRNDLTYVAASHRSFRMYEHNGTIFCDYSPDGTTWINYTSLVNPWAVTAVILEMSAGCFAVEASGTTATFDDFNIQRIARFNNKGLRPYRFAPGLAR